MSTEIKAYKCLECGLIYEDKEIADNCCKCTLCKYYIGKFSKKLKWVHCSRGYDCDSYSSKGVSGTYSMFERLQQNTEK